MDRRLTPANERVAASYLIGKVKTKNFVVGVKEQCKVGAVDLLDEPGGDRVSQLCRGDRVRVFERFNGFAYVQVEKDNYCGYITETILEPCSKFSHWICVPGSILYSEANFKKKEICELYFGDQVLVISDDGIWAELNDGGFVPSCHLKKNKIKFLDHVFVSRLFLNTPYLWGGCSRKGIDCSGLVQLALHACGIECPRDTDMQEASLGRNIEQSKAMKGDLIFWRGHVGMLIKKNLILHANAYHMSVVEESFDLAKIRIEKNEGGKVTSVRRI